MSFGEAFATPSAIIHRAFHRIAGDLHIAGFFARMKLRARISGAFHDAHRAGDTRRGEREVGALLADHEWRWPLFDKAITEFSARRIWPLIWVADGMPADTTWEAMSGIARARLLVLTLETACYCDRDREQVMKMVREKTLLRGWKQRLEPSQKDCPVERLMIERHSSAIERHAEKAALPPYFPGDGLGLRLHTPRRR